MLKQSRHERKCLKAAKDHFTSAKLFTHTWGIDFTKPCIGTFILMCLLWQLFTLYCNICLKFTYCPHLNFPLHHHHVASPPSLLSICSSVSSLERSQEREAQARRQMLEEERRRREEAERRLQDETAHRQRLVEEEVKMREKHFSQVSGAAGGDGREGGRGWRETWGWGWETRH